MAQRYAHCVRSGVSVLALAVLLFALGTIVASATEEPERCISPRCLVPEEERGHWDVFYVCKPELAVIVAGNEDKFWKVVKGDLKRVSPRLFRWTDLDRKPIRLVYKGRRCVGPYR